MQHRQSELLWQEYVSPVAWGSVALFIALVLGYSATFYAVFNNSLPLWLAAGFCMLLCYAAFTVVHEAGHGNIVVADHPAKPLEAVLGWLASVPLLLVPYGLFKVLHDRHHAFTNDPQRDPDYFAPQQSGLLGFVLHCYRIPGHYYRLTFQQLAPLPSFSLLLRAIGLYGLVVYGGLIAAFVQGYWLEALSLILLPCAIAVLALVTFFDYLPHRPHRALAAIHNTRIVPGRMLNALLLGQNYHLIHHLYPRVPWYRYQPLYWALRPGLQQQGARIHSALLPTETLQQQEGRHWDSLDHCARLLKRTQLTADTTELTLAVADVSSVDYQAGQYILLSVWYNNDWQQRCYSLCAAPYFSTVHQSLLLTIAVKQVHTGGVSHYIHQHLQLEANCLVRGPFGDFVLPALAPSHVPLAQSASLQSRPFALPKHCILVAAGSGMTPVMALLQQALALPEITAIDLAIACRGFNARIYGSKLDKLAEIHQGRLRIHWFFSGEFSGESCQPQAPEQLLTATDNNSITVGRITHSGLREFLIGNDCSISGQTRDKSTLSHSQAFVCGPQSFMTSVTSWLAAFGVSPGAIFTEAFSSGAAAADVSADKTEADKTEVDNETRHGASQQHPVTLVFNHGAETTLQVAEGQSLLQAAVANQVTIPHACGNGTCGSCRCQRLSGEVAVIGHTHSAICESEQDAGFILACQSQPRSPLRIKIMA